MKTAVILFILLYFISAKSWDELEETSYTPCATSDSWDLKPLNPYADTVIVVDPYAESRDDRDRY